MAAAIAAAEGGLVLGHVLPWLAVVLAALVATALYLGLFRGHRNPDLRAASWVAATSQSLVVLAPVLALVTLTLAIGLVVLLGAAFLVLLLRDRR